jgi:hypothetical protein
VLWIVLPTVALPGLSAVHVAIEIVVLIEIIVVVDVDVAVVPIAVAPVAAPSPPCGSSQRNSRSPHQSRPWHVARIGVWVVRILNRSRPVHHSRVVGGHINNVRIRLLDLDDLLAAGNSLGLHYRLGAGF